ncbi:protein phosphatase 1 regulatory subunit 15A-like isoform X2 [Sinocyclocheilus anshuiensis]|uniref:protein phosphatase 1 regulatory subunit 15A-like isoform X2 n=1 Tax=Sinocyclocheilus anshuiensis TaxID=1608454 RepID=UPI0007B8B4DA|nr:PREDICTED: protein phosphatase 1 regulatory subunit 15A-like isoform X2 [Sinocyclocheilus anshuiensis]
MAPFTISPHHPLPYQCGLPQKGQSKMSPELWSGSPGDPYRRTSIVQIRVGLWQLVQRVLNFCTSVTELLRSKMFLFICVGKTMTMTDELKKSGVEEVLERPGGEISDGASEMKVVMESDDDERESSALDSDEEEDDEARRSDEETNEEEEDDEARLSDEETDEEEDEDKEDCETEDEDSGWSDEDEADSEASAESLELWESFLNSGDPYNPLSFCSSIGSRTNTEQNQQTQPPPATRPDESEPNPKPNSKVCFSDQLTVRPLVAWSFASRAARDGSCWMQMARDRERFRRRAESIETLLKPCLTAEHRAGVWERLQRKTSS